jgi:hypothetical protein
MTTTAQTTTTQTTTTVADFNFFEGVTSESSSRPQITIRKGGLLVLTRAAVAMLGDDVDRVQLAYSRTTGAVGIRAALKDTTGSYLLRVPKKGPSRLITGKRFFKHCGLPVETARTFEVEEFGNGIIGFHLQVEPATPVSAEPAKPVSRRKAQAA